MVLKVVATLVLFAFFVNLCLLLHNVMRYLLPLKIKGMLIALFYIFAAVLTVSRAIELIYYILPSNKSPSLTYMYASLGQNIADNVADIANVVLGCLFVATMY